MISKALAIQHVQRITFPKAGNDLYPGDAVKPYLDFTLGRKELNQLKVMALCRKAQRHLPAAVCLPLPWAGLAKELLKESPVRVAALVKDPQAEETKEAVRENADEIEMVVDVQALKRGELDKVESEIRAVVGAAEGREVKATVQAPLLTGDEIRTACKLSEKAGARFVKTDTGDCGTVTLDQVRIMKESCNLGIEVASAVTTLAACREFIKLIGPDRPVRFETSWGYQIANTEERDLASETDEKNRKLASSLFTPKGMKAFHEAQGYLNQLLQRIDEAHTKGVPVVYLSVPVRSNEMGDINQNRGLREQLMQECKTNGAEYVDPFAANEELEFLKDPDMDPVLVQELLMDPESGIWPNVLKACDAIAHDDEWKYSLGAKTEHLLALKHGVPLWDRKSKPALRS